MPCKLGNKLSPEVLTGLSKSGVLSPKLGPSNLLVIKVMSMMFCLMLKPHEFIHVDRTEKLEFGKIQCKILY